MVDSTSFFTCFKVLKSISKKSAIYEDRYLYQLIKSKINKTFYITVYHKYDNTNDGYFVTYKSENQKDALTFASSGTGAIPHLAGELFQQSTGIKLTHIPYKGAPLAMTDLISGRVNMMFDNLPTVLPHIRGGKLRALAIAGSKQTRALPNVPTLAELGIRGAEVTSWFGVLAPNGLPMPIAKRLNDEIVKILSTNEVKAQLFEMGAEPFVLPSDEFVKFLDGDIKRWTKLVKDASIQVD